MSYLFVLDSVHYRIPVLVSGIWIMNIVGFRIAQAKFFPSPDFTSKNFKDSEIRILLRGAIMRNNNNNNNTNNKGSKLISCSNYDIMTYMI